MIKYKNIAIEGNIGAGKTTLATKLADVLNANLILEQFSDNPFLPKFYKNQRQYAFPLEMSFLLDRYEQLKEKQEQRNSNSIIISDYFFSKTLIFAKNNLDDDEYRLFNKTFFLLNEQIETPDLVIYLYLDVFALQKNIKQRGRDYEKNIEGTYLQSLQKQYIDFLEKIKSTKVIILDINNIDFVKKNDDFDKILRLIEV